MIGHLVDEGEANVASETDSNQKEQNLNIDQSAESLDNFISTPSKLEENEVIPDVFIDNYTTTYDIIENANDIIETIAVPDPVETSNEVTKETMINENNAVEEILPTPSETTDDTEASGITTDQNNILEHLSKKEDQTEKMFEESITNEENSDVIAKSDLDNLKEIQVPNEIDIEAPKESLSIIEESKIPTIKVENHISEKKNSKNDNTENNEQAELSYENIGNNSLPANNIHKSTPETETEVVPPPRKSFEPQSKYTALMLTIKHI